MTGVAHRLLPQIDQIWKENKKVRIIHTVQMFNSCTSRPDIWKCLVVQHLWITCQRNMPSKLMTHVFESKLRSVLRSGTYHIHAQENGWQSGVRSCIMRGVSTHLLQEINAGTVFSTCVVVHRIVGNLIKHHTMVGHGLYPSIQERNDLTMLKIVLPKFLPRCQIYFIPDCTRMTNVS